MNTITLGNLNAFRLEFPRQYYPKVKPVLEAMATKPRFCQFPGTPHWEVDAVPDNVPAIQQLIDEHGFACDELVAAALDALKATPVASHRAVYEDGVLKLYFPRNASVLKKVQALKRRFFIYAQPLHWQIPLILDNAEHLLSFINEFELDSAAAIAIQQLGSELGTQPKGMRVLVENGRIYIELPQKSPLEVDVVRLSGARRDTRWRWQIPVLPASVDRIIDLASCHHVDLNGVEDELFSLVQRHKANVENSKKHNSDIIFHGIKGTPRPFQKAGVEYAMKAKRCLIGDQQGLGKTVQAMLWFHALGALPVLIICPPSLVSNWREEIHRWIPQYNVGVLKGNKPNVGDYDANIIICSYSIVGARVKNGMIGELEKRGFRSLVCDESHYLKNWEKDKYKKYKTKRVQAVWEISRLAEYCLLLSGTPITNKPIEFVAQLDILQRLDDFGGFDRFSREFCGAHRGGFGWMYSAVSPEKLHSLNELLRGSACFVRRLKSEVMAELPAKQRTVVPFALANAVQYEKAELDIIDYITQLVDADTVFAQTIAFYDEATQTQLIKERKHEKAHSAQKAEQLVRINVLKNLATEGKIDAIIEWIDDFISGGDKLIVFAHHRWVQARLCAHYASGARLIAGDSAEAQQAFKHRFQTDPHCLTIICSDSVGREGHTLTAASNVAFVELGWTPTGHEQCEDRAHRIGQENAVNVYYLLAERSIDYDIYQIIESKRIMVDAATNGYGSGQEDTGMMKELFESIQKKYRN